MKATYENHYLSDNDVANFARQSFAQLADNFTDEQNSKLIQFLARGMASGNWDGLIKRMVDLTHHANPYQAAKDMAVYLRKIPEHWVPFGHPQISIRLEAPVPIARQMFKHKIGMVESEESRRYISYEPQIFIPEHFRAAPSNKKQGSDGVHERSREWQRIYGQQTHHAVSTYMAMIDDGVCPEQARLVLPQGAEVRWVATGSLYAWSNVFNQRSDSHAQEEIQELAKQIGQIIEPLYPVSWKALTQGEY